jgi:hypothetical protein
LEGLELVTSSYCWRRPNFPQEMGPIRQSLGEKPEAAQQQPAYKLHIHVHGWINLHSLSVSQKLLDPLVSPPTLLGKSERSGAHALPPALSAFSPCRSGTAAPFLAKAAVASRTAPSEGDTGLLGASSILPLHTHESSVLAK